MACAMEKDLLTALIPIGVSTGRFGVKTISLMEKTALLREIFHRKTFLNFPAAAAGATPGRPRTRRRSIPSSLWVEGIS
jgi:hypothetical protein